MRRLHLDDLWSFAIPSSPALAPNGSQVVYVLRTADRESDRNRRALWSVATVPGATPAPLTTGWADTAPAWSPDGSRIAFLRADDGPPQVHLIPAGGGEPRRVTDLPLGSGAPRWSPDGRRIAFSAPVAVAPLTGPVVIRRLGYKADGVGLRARARIQVHVLDLADGRVRQLTEGEWDAGDPAWSPDGTLLAYASATGPDADLALTSGAHVVDAETGLTRAVGDGKGWIGGVSWFPDVSALLATGSTAVRIGHTQLLRLPLDGGEPVDLAGALDRNLMPGGPEWPGGTPQFTKDGTVVFCARDRGSTLLYRGTEAVPLPPGTSVAGLSLAGDLAAAVIVTGSSHGEISLIDLGTGEARQLTGHTRAALPDVEFIQPEQREFTISDGTVVHGWIVRDPATTGAGPLLLDAHGGPHLAWAPHLEPAHPYHQLLAAQGWTVLLLNPRASDGYGEEFYAASVGRWGIGDERDFLEPVEQLVAEGLAGPDRLAVCGYSYGGFTTCHLTTRTGRFAAAVAGGPVTNLLSMAGSSDDAPTFAALEFGGDIYAGGELLRAQSPIERVHQVTTPTLLVHAVNDDRCPVGQSEEWFTALRTLGVPTEMVLYPDESHQFLADGRPSNRVDYSRQIVRWVTGRMP
ncbi:S9 family peptidase [Nonomuraea polychroma]|uniref:S9 family peptidase n=1 Tax=Nonomuraea polychroma TaxID=46176 RepID=UPI003D8DE50B